MLKHLSTFNDFIFPDNGNIVYVLCCSNYSIEFPIPFYVGQSSCHIGRLGNYISAKFSAATDFKVGEAIKYLRSDDFQVTFKYQEVENPRGSERTLINALKKDGYTLLNDLKSYNYKTADENTERERIHKFIKELVVLNVNLHTNNG